MFLFFFVLFLFIPLLPDHLSMSAFFCFLFLFFLFYESKASRRNGAQHACTTTPVSSPTLQSTYGYNETRNTIRNRTKNTKISYYPIFYALLIRADFLSNSNSAKFSSFVRKRREVIVTCYEQFTVQWNGFGLV